jgi:hypothetical protein
MNYYKSVLSGNQTRLNFEDEDSFKRKVEEMYKYFSEDMMNWKTFSIFVKKIETMGIFTSLIKKLKLMRLQKKKKLKVFYIF